MADSHRDEITRIIAGQRAGQADSTIESTSDSAAEADRMMEIVYGELRRLAAGHMRRERPGHTLQPTALVHEVYLKLVDQSRVEWEDRSHFIGVAARAMRQVLVDHARRHAAVKRGGDLQRITFTTSVMNLERGPLIEALDFEDALTKLGAADERSARVVELRVFGGLSIREIASALGISERTVDRSWTFARMWLRRELSQKQ